MLVERYSISALETFSKCPLQFKLKYIERVRTPTGVEAFMGRCVHKALEEVHPALESEGRVGDDVLREAYESAWHSGMGKEDIVIIREERDLDSYFHAGLKGARWYAANYEPAGPTVFAEKRIEFDIEDVPFVTVPDRVTRSGDGRYVIHDYKTSASPPSGSHMRDDRQLPIYQHAVQRSIDDAKEVSLIWHYVCIGQRYRGSRSSDQIEAVLGSIVSDVRRIEAASDFPPRSTPLCRWCFYWDRCPAMGFKQRTIIDGHIF